MLPQRPFLPVLMAERHEEEVKEGVEGGKEEGREEREKGREERREDREGGKGEREVKCESCMWTEKNNSSIFLFRI